MELGAGEILVILVVVLLLFGPSRLPQLGESLGRAVRDLRKAMAGTDKAMSAPEAPARRPLEQPPAAARDRGPT